MKKVWIVSLLTIVTIGLAGCDSTSNSSKSGTSTKDSNTEQATEDIVDQENEKIEKKLGEEGIDVVYNNGKLILTREKSVDYDYFEMTFLFSGDTDEIFDVELQLKGNIDGKNKDLLHYEISNGRMVEVSYRNSDIQELAEVLESTSYSDKDLVEFAYWYRNK